MSQHTNQHHTLKESTINKPHDSYLHILMSCLLFLCCGQLTASANEAAKVDSTVDSSVTLRYPLAPFDHVSISVYQQPDLTSSQRISDVGTISLPLVGEIAIAGLNTSEAQRKIAKAYIDQEFFIKPVVTVRIDSFTTQTVTVLGEVSSPGQIPLPDGVRKIAIQRIIGMAGDFSDIAKKSAVRVERRKPGQAKPEIFVIDVGKIVEATGSKQAANTFEIQPGDILFVPRRAF